MLGEILDHAKLAAGMLTIEHIGFDIGSIISYVRQLLSPLSLSRNVRMTFDVHNEIPRRLVGDPSRLQQVLLNFVSNALKYTPPGGTVSVSVSPVPRENEGALIASSKKAAADSFTPSSTSSSIKSEILSRASDAQTPSATQTSDLFDAERALAFLHFEVHE
jgi:signal transduction histidine kinase